MSRKKSLWSACRVKKVHYNFWTAIQHCSSLAQEDPNCNIYIYKCDFCSGMHVTRGQHSQRAKKKIQRGLARNLRMMRDPDFWYRAEPKIVEGFIRNEMELLRKIMGIQPMIDWIYDDNESIPSGNDI